MANTLTLPPDLAAKVQAHVDSGAADAVEVVRAGLVALEAAEAAKLEALRAKLGKAIADQSPSSTSAEVFARIEAVLSRK